LKNTKNHVYKHNDTQRHETSLTHNPKERENPRFLKMKVTKNIKQAAVKSFAEVSIVPGATIRSDGYRSCSPALTAYDHEPAVCNPDSALLHWIHIAISNAKAFVLGTYHGLPRKNLDAYLDEYCFRFSRCSFGPNLFDRLVVAMSAPTSAYLNG